MASRARLTRRLPVLGRSRTVARGPSRVGDRILFGLCASAALLAVLTLAGVVYLIVSNAAPAISRVGIGFLVHETWAPNQYKFGASALIYGTVVSSLFAIALAGPLGVAIALYLSMIAPPAVRAVVGPMVEMLAAVPSVIMGFWGVVVLAPFLQAHVEPALHSALGFIPLFGPPQTTGLSMFTAGLILALMILPIVASLSRDLFLTVPEELRDGAAALGATRWEIIRGVVLPTTVSGVVAATLLALGRAIGEAIAVYQVIGGLIQAKASLFEPATTIASRIALDVQSPDNKLHIAAIFYIALVLLAIGLATSLIARLISSRFDVQRVLAR